MKLKRRVLRIWINRLGKIRRELLRPDYTDTPWDDLTLLEKTEPPISTCKRWTKRGYRLSNWHVIETTA